MPIIQILAFGMLVILFSYLVEENINIKLNTIIKYIGIILILLSSITIIYSLAN